MCNVKINSRILLGTGYMQNKIPEEEFCTMLALIIKIRAGKGFFKVGTTCDVKTAKTGILRALATRNIKTTKIIILQDVSHMHCKSSSIGSSARCEFHTI